MDTSHDGHYEALRERLNPYATRIAARIDAGLAPRRGPLRTVSLYELVTVRTSPSAAGDGSFTGSCRCPPSAYGALLHLSWQGGLGARWGDTSARLGGIGLAILARHRSPPATPRSGTRPAPVPEPSAPPNERPESGEISSSSGAPRKVQETQTCATLLAAHDDRPLGTR
jgi:hypothetical protein